MSRPALFLAAVLGAAALAIGGGGGPARAQTTPAARPTTQQAFAAARTFVAALAVPLTSRNIARLSHRDLVVVDGDDATPRQIAALKAHGTVVLGYLSVGSVESWRSWFPLLQAHRLDPLGDWPGERYTDVSNADARAALADTITPKLLAKGFDGLFLDVVDELEDYPAQSDGMLDLVTRIAARVHAGGGVLMAQNGDSIIAPFVPLLDGWNREDPTGTYDFDAKRYGPTDVAGRRSARATIRAARAAGKLVTTIDYFGSPTSASAGHAIRLACKAGAVPYVGTIDLDMVPKAAAHC